VEEVFTALPSVRVVFLCLAADSNAADFPTSKFAAIFPNAEKIVFYFEPQQAQESITNFFDQLVQGAQSKLREVIIVDKLCVCNGKVLEEAVELPSHTKRFSFV
jgi:hypothetical protein